MSKQDLDTLHRMFEDESQAEATPLANQLQAIARIVVRSALRRYPKDLGLSFVHAAIIGGIGTFGPISARDLATILTMHEGQLSRNIKQLEDNDLISRIPDPADSRRKMLMLSRKGKNLYNKVMNTQKSREENFLAGISAGDRDRFYRTLNRIRANAEKELAADSAEGLT